MRKLKTVTIYFYVPTWLFIGLVTIYRYTDNFEYKVKYLSMYIASINFSLRE